MKFLRNAFTCLLVVMMIISSTNSALADTDKKSEIVDIKDGEKIALFYTLELSNTISELDDWNNATVEYEMTYYDFNGNITAYAFNVMKNNEYQGYMVISATKDEYPILEFSKGELPNMIPEIEAKSKEIVAKYASKNALSVNTDQSIPIYEGATFYYQEYKGNNKQKKYEKRMIVDLSTGNISDVDEIQLSSSATNKKKVKDVEIEEAWSSLESQMTEEIISSKATTYHGFVASVPYELWYRSCAPTAAAMVLEYWDAKGYSKFPSGKTLIGKLADAMGTVGTSTSERKIDDGIEKVSKSVGYSNFDAVSDFSMTLYEIEREIDANRPFVLSMQGGGAGSGHTNPYGEHAVTCVGYTDTSTTDYLFIHDTWDTNIHYITYKNWDSANATWVRS